MTEPMFFDGWRPIWRVLVVGAVSYTAMVVLLSFFGKRALSKMSAFDLVVTVALGSALANAALSRDLSLTEAVLAFAMLLALQWLLAGVSIHVGWFGRYLKAQPTLLVYRGVILWDAAKSEQLSELEILGGLRSKGIAAVEDVLAMVLEPDGSFSVIPISAAPGTKVPTALSDVTGVPEFSDKADPAAARKMPGRAA